MVERTLVRPTMLFCWAFGLSAICRPWRERRQWRLYVHLPLALLLEDTTTDTGPGSGRHIGVLVGEECLLPATVCAHEYFSLFSKGAVSRLDQLKPQLAPARAAQRGRRLDEGTHSLMPWRSNRRNVLNSLSPRGSRVNVHEVHGFQWSYLFWWEDLETADGAGGVLN
jgi:hypothetical protein